MSSSEPRNPLYLLLLLGSLLFVVTALAYAVVPVLEQKAADAGQPPPPSEFRDALRADGWRWLLWEVGLMVVLGIASMVLDRLRALGSVQRMRGTHRTSCFDGSACTGIAPGAEVDPSTGSRPDHSQGASANH